MLQASSSHLYQLGTESSTDLTGAGPALFSVFSGADDHMDHLPAYLVAAAANESRAFPSFVYDPNAGDTWADRVSLEANPSGRSRLASASVMYEDSEHQRVQTNIDFTLADFVSCDRRFAPTSCTGPRNQRERRDDAVAEILGRVERTECLRNPPNILMVDAELDFSGSSSTTH